MQEKCIKYDTVLIAASNMISGRTYKDDREYSEELNRALRAVAMSMTNAGITIIYMMGEENADSMNDWLDEI